MKKPASWPAFSLGFCQLAAFSTPAVLWSWLNLPVDKAIMQVRDGGLVATLELPVGG